MFWHQFDLPKCQVNWGNAAVCLNVHFDGLIAYYLHFAPKTSKRTIDDLYDAAFESLVMFSHTTLRFSCGLRLPGIFDNFGTVTGRKAVKYYSLLQPLCTFPLRLSPAAFAGKMRDGVVQHQDQRGALLAVRPLCRSRVCRPWKIRDTNVSHSSAARVSR